MYLHNDKELFGDIIALTAEQNKAHQHWCALQHYLKSFTICP